MLIPPRRLATVLSVTAVAAVVACTPTGESVSCDDDACIALCEEHAAGDGTEQMEARALSGSEAAHIADRLLRFRRGPQPVEGPRALAICRGATRCEEVRETRGPLPDGTWVVHAELDLPPDGRWTIIYERTCSFERDRQRVREEETRTYEATAPRSGEPYVLEAIEAFRSPAAMPTDCSVRLVTGDHKRGIAALDFQLPGAR